MLSGMLSKQIVKNLLTNVGDVCEQSRMDKTMPCEKCKGTGRVQNPVSVGFEMRHLRQRCGKSLSAVARKLKISKAYVSDLERGHRVWSSDLLMRFTKVCEGKI